MSINRLVLILVSVSWASQYNIHPNLVQANPNNYYAFISYKHNRG